MGCFNHQPGTQHKKQHDPLVIYSQVQVHQTATLLGIGESFTWDHPKDQPIYLETSEKCSFLDFYCFYLKLDSCDWLSLWVAGVDKYSK